MTFAEFYTPALLAMLGIKPDDPDLANKTTAATKSLDSALALIESYLDRWLEYKADQVETFGPPPQSRALLRRYPAESVSEVSFPAFGQWQGATIPSTAYGVDLRRGIVFVISWGFGGWGWSGAVLQITYAGGFKNDAWPLDLLNVVLALAASLFPGVYETGAPVPAPVSGDIKRITIPDAGAVEYQSQGDGGAGASVLGFGDIPASMIGVLDRYRAESAVGVG